MSDKPILFSAPMIRALLEGRKTQTRREITRNNCTVLGTRWGRTSPWDGLRFAEAWARNKNPLTGVTDSHLAVPFCHPQDEPTPTEDCAIYRVRPEIEPGDHLWVREACATWGSGPDRPDVPYPVAYAADDHEWEAIRREARGRRDEWKVRPSIHMPRWASRLTLIVTSVQVQRLQEISEDDAIAEGAHKRADGYWTHDGENAAAGENPAKRSFHILWETINGPGSWEANPWIAAYTFTVHRRNIDALANAEPAP